MPEFLIESLDDPRLEPYLHLKYRNLTRWSGRFIAEGIRLVERLLESRYPVESILVSEKRRHRLPDSINAQTNIYIASVALLEEVVGYQFHAGMLACGMRLEPVPLHSWLPERTQRSLIVGCPQTADPDNLGSIIRIAAAFGADGLMVGRGSADPYSRKTLRTSMGNAFYLPTYESLDFAEDVQSMQREYGYVVTASVLDEDAIPLTRVSRPEKRLFLLGNEVHGLDSALADLADEKVMIPMAEKIDSLNVAVAAGIMLHHFTQVCAEQE